MTAASRAKSVRVVYERRFIDGLQDLDQSGLHQFVFQYRDSQWPPLLAARFGDVYPQDRLRDVDHPVESFHQLGEVLLQIFRISFFGDMVNTASGFSFELLEAFPQKFFVHQMKETGELERRFLAGFLRYAFQFRFHTFFVTGHDVCFSSTPLLSCLPSLGQHYPPSSVLRRHPTPCRAYVFLALLSLVQHTLFPLKDPARSPGLPSIPNIQHAMLYDPGETDEHLPVALTHVDFRVVNHVILPNLALSRLNHFSFRLRPVVLIPLCLIFGVTAADPEFSTRWLACLAGTGLTPA